MGAGPDDLGRRSVPPVLARRERLRALSVSPVSRRERPPPKRRRGLLWFWLSLLALVAVFGLGLALGQALQDNPKPGGTQTVVRTLKPLPIPPARETVTVTRP